MELEKTEEETLESLHPYVLKFAAKAEEMIDKGTGTKRMMFSQINIDLEEEIVHIKIPRSHKPDFEGEVIEVSATDITPTSLQSRFRSLRQGRETLFFIKTSIYQEIKNFIFEKKKEPQGYYLIHGRIGIGKSCGLALAVSDFRKEEPKNEDFIFYINDPANFNGYEFAKEFVFSLKSNLYFQKDAKMALKTLCHKYEFLDPEKYSEAFESFDEFITVFGRKIITNDLKVEALVAMLLHIKTILKQNVIVIIDQMPEINPPDPEDQWPFVSRLIKRMIAQPGLPIFFCSSQGSKDLKRKITSDNVLKLNGKFSYEEAKVYLFKRLNRKVLDSKLSEDEIIKFSEFNPLELSEICSFFQNCKEQMTTESFLWTFSKEREPEIERHVAKFESKKMDKWCFYLTMSFLDLPIENPSNDNIDENIAYLEKIEGQEGYKLLRFSNSSYKKKAFAQNWNEIKNNLNTLLQPSLVAIQKLNALYRISGRTKGEIFEINILNFMSHRAISNQTPELSCFIWKSNGAENAPIKFSFREATIFRAENYSLGCLIKDYLTKARTNVKVETVYEHNVALFIPNWKTYEGIDAVFVDPDQKKIFLVQITVNINSHFSTNNSKKRKHPGSKEVPPENRPNQNKSLNDESPVFLEEGSENFEVKSEDEVEFEDVEDNEGKTETAPTDKILRNSDSNQPDPNQKSEVKTTQVPENKKSRGKPIKKEKEESKKRQTSKISTDKKIMEILKKTQEISDNKESEEIDMIFSQKDLQNLIKVLKRDLQDCEVQWIWIGLPNGVWKDKKKHREDCLRNLHPDSWMICVDECPEFGPLQAACGFD